MGKGGSPKLVSTVIPSCHNFGMTYLITSLVPNVLVYFCLVQFTVHKHITLYTSIFLLGSVHVSFIGECENDID